MDALLSTNLGFPTPTVLQEVFQQWEPDPKKYPGAELLPVEGYPLELVEWDIYSAVSGMTQATVPGADPPFAEFIKLGHKQLRALYFADTLRFTQTDIQRVRRAGTINALAGEELVMRGLRLQDYRVETRLEWLRWQALMNALAVDENGTKRTFDFGFPAGHVVTPATPWSTVATATPVEDLQAATELFLGKSDGRPTMWINSVDVKWLARNATVRDLLKQSVLVLQLGREKIAEIFPQLVGDLESIRIIKSGWKDGALTYTSFLPNGRVLLTAPPPHGQRLGAVRTTPDVRNGGVDPKPGKWVLIEDKLQSKNPYYDITAGVSAAPCIFFPECIAVLKIYEA